MRYPNSALPDLGHRVVEDPAHLDEDLLVVQILAHVVHGVLERRELLLADALRRESRHHGLERGTRLDHRAERSVLELQQQRDRCRQSLAVGLLHDRAAAGGRV